MLSVLSSPMPVRVGLIQREGRRVWGTGYQVPTKAPSPYAPVIAPRSDVSMTWGSAVMVPYPQMPEPLLPMSLFR